MKAMVSISNPFYVLYGFGSYLLVMFVFMGTAVGLHELGHIFGLPPVIAGGWLYTTPVFLLLYLLSCYDDFSAVVMELANYKKVFSAG